MVDNLVEDEVKLAARSVAAFRTSKKERVDSEMQVVLVSLESIISK